MDKDTELKVGALHLRLMDDEEQYSKFLANLIYYNKDNKQYTEDVLTALEDGLENYSRYQKLDNALSPRFIRIEKRVFNEGQKLKVNDTEGAYHVIFHFDDDKEEVVHFKRKQDQSVIHGICRMEGSPEQRALRLFLHGRVRHYWNEGQVEHPKQGMEASALRTGDRFLRNAYQHSPYGKPRMDSVHKHNQLRKRRQGHQDHRLAECRQSRLDSPSGTRKDRCQLCQSGSPRF